MVASYYGFSDIVKLLLDNNVITELTNKENQTALKITTNRIKSISSVEFKGRFDKINKIFQLNEVYTMLVRAMYNTYNHIDNPYVFFSTLNERKNNNKS